MRSSFFATLVIASMTLVSAAPLDAHGGCYGGGGGHPSPPKGKGGNAQTGNSGNANGGSVYNDAGWWGYIYNCPYANKAGDGGFGSVTNLRKDPPHDATLQQDGKEAKESTNPPFLPTPNPSQPKRSRHKSPEIVKPLLYNEVAEPTSRSVIADALPQDPREHEYQNNSRKTPSDSEHLYDTTTDRRDFLEDAVVWIARPNDVPRHPPSTSSIPTGHRLNTLDALLIACGWTDVETNAMCDWVQKGVIFVDEGSDWKSYPLGRLMDKRSSIVNSSENPVKMVKAVWILSSHLLDGHRSAWAATGRLSLSEVEKFVICKFG